LEEALQGIETRRRIDPRRIARDHNAVVLAYWLAQPRSFVWIVTPSSVDVVALPAAPLIDRQVEAYARQVANLGTSEDTLRKNGADLFATLVGEATSRIGAASRIIVVPDGRLNAFNMETLVVPNTRRYWIEDVTLVTAASLELLDREQPTAAPTSMLVVGDPPSPDLEFPVLKNGAKEIRLVATHFRTHTILDGPAATPSAYERAGAERFGYIHFVAHGVATRQVPLDSAVVLARGADDFKLYARDIIKQQLRARLVTISSCHGAGTRSYTGEGLVGLAWAFLRAGAQQVIAALWEVDEAATPQLMDDLYTGIQEGRDPASALRAAKLRLVHSHSLRRRPYYWAPFVLYSGS
jgi:CHAT domain-containing protein